MNERQDKQVVIFKQSAGYKIMEDPELTSPSHLKLISLKQFEMLEAALESFILHGEISNEQE